MATAIITAKIKDNLPPVAPPDDKVEAYPTEIPIEYIDEAWRQAIPDEILLGFLRDGRLRVIAPLNVKLTYEGKHTISEAIELDEFGFGNNVSEAISDLQHAIAELYFTLDKEQNRLGADLQKIWNVLQKKIIKR